MEASKVDDMYILLLSSVISLGRYNDLANEALTEATDCEIPKRLWSTISEKNLFAIEYKLQRNETLHMRYILRILQCKVIDVEMGTRHIGYCRLCGDKEKCKRQDFWQSSHL